MSSPSITNSALIVNSLATTRGLSEYKFTPTVLSSPFSLRRIGQVKRFKQTFFSGNADNGHDAVSSPSSINAARYRSITCATSHGEPTRDIVNESITRAPGGIVIAEILS